MKLSSGDYEIELQPELGGSIRAFSWRGIPLMRPTSGDSILDTACFPLVPFSNRIRDGQFLFRGRTIRLAPNFPGRVHPHTLHGFGWLNEWGIRRTAAGSAVMDYNHVAGEWPWDFRATQEFRLNDHGLEIELSITNLSPEPMPCGLGLHPYFPCNQETHVKAFHLGEVIVDEECLPVGSLHSETPKDWWDGYPVCSRVVDTLFLNRVGDVRITWPDQRCELVMQLSEQLRHSVIYSPLDEIYVCVEPVSHQTNSFNDLPPQKPEHVELPTGDSITARCRFAAREVASPHS